MVRGSSAENIILAQLEDAMVVDMNDGGMGGIRFCDQNGNKRVLGRQISEATYVDKDGVPVSLTLNIDQQDKIFELDIWKADNSTLKSYPRPEDVTLIRKDN